MWKRSDLLIQSVASLASFTILFYSEYPFYTKAQGIGPLNHPKHLDI